MKIAIISDHYNKGGAAIAGKRIAEGYEKNGYEVEYIVGFNDFKISRIHDFQSFNLGGKDYRFNVNAYTKSYAFQYLISIYYVKKIIKLINKITPDIIHLHNIHGKIPFPLIFKSLYRTNIPIIWTLHDMWSFTGHCGYSLDCNLYRNGGCNLNCPYPDEFPPLKKKYVEKQYGLRKIIYQKAKNLHIVTPSNWLANEAKNTIIGDLPIHVIPNGLDTSFYFPIEKRSALIALGLNPKHRYILTGGMDLKSKRKGLRYLIGAINHIKTENLHLIIYGNNDAVNNSQVRIPVHNIGFIDNEPLLRILYSAADVFVLPTIADNLPNVLLESISCGTPCVGFNTGGLTEIIEEDETGYVAEFRNSKDLGEKLSQIVTMDSKEYKKMTKKCRAKAEKAYCNKKQAKKYLMLIEKTISKL